MACSSPIRLYKKDLKQSFRNNHSDFELSALRKSFNTHNYKEVPCRYCLNCRVDRQNELVDRAEYEYIKYGYGAFVTFTYDDVHLFSNSYIDSHSGELKSTLNKKDIKDFLNRLNKLVHKEVEYRKKTLTNYDDCRPDYKYIVTGEYGDQFNRPHFHALFFGLDFITCERLFWRAWKFKGNIEVGPIKNGGIAYATKYIQSQSYGIDDFYKYTYHGLTKPFSNHSLGFGSGLYEDQLKYIKKNNGYYYWHGKNRPVPVYYKNKYKIITDLDENYINKKFQSDKEKALNLHNIKIKTYKDYENYCRTINKIREAELLVKLRQQGKKIYNQELSNIEKSMLNYNDLNRLNPKNDNNIVTIIKPQGTKDFKYKNQIIKTPFTNRQAFKLGTSYNQLIKSIGIENTNLLFYGEPIPF